MQKKACFSIIALGFACAACAPFGSGNEPSLEQRVQQQDIQLRQMQPQQADTWNQLQAMKQELDTLKGQLDDLNNAGGAKAIADKVRQHDAALRQVDNNMALNLELGSPLNAATPQQSSSYGPAIPMEQQTPQTGVPMTGMSGLQPTGAPDSSAYGAARTVPAQQQTGSYGLPPATTATSLPGAAQPVQAPAESTWGQADPRPQQPTLVVPKKDISLALFDAGVNSYNARDYAAAQRSFADFLKNYPSHSQTAEAQYYLAECDFQRNQFPQAALAYDAVIKKYPKSSSAPGAYLKQAICFSKMGQSAAARQRMQEIINKFPNTPEATRAKNFLKTNK